MKGVVVEQRVGVRDQERRHARGSRERDAAERAPAGARLCIQEARRDGRDERHERDPGGVLARAGEPQADPRQQVVAQSSFAQHARAAEQRQGQRRERRHVVEREVRIEDGQERDRLDRRRQQADAAAEQARAGRIQQPQRGAAEHGGGDAGERVHLGRVVRERVHRPRRAAVGEREQEVQHVGERGRVFEVVGVEAVVFEHRDRARQEMVGLVGVVGVRQPLAHAPQAQHEAADQDCRQRGPRPPAGDLNSWHRPRSSGSCRCA